MLFQHSVQNRENILLMAGFRHSDTSWQSIVLKPNTQVMLALLCDNFIPWLVETIKGTPFPYLCSCSLFRLVSFT